MRVLAFLACFATQPVLALSCLPTTPQGLYAFAAKAEEAYLPVVGTFVLPGPIRQQQNDLGLPKGQSIAAQFQGKAFNGTNISTPYERPVKVTISCAASWCGSVDPTQSYLAILKQDGDGLSFSANACSGHAIANPTAAMIQRFERCAAGGAC